MVQIGADSHDPNKGGGLIDKAGRYHVVAERVDEKENQVNVKFKCLGGDHSDQVGCVLTNYLDFPMPSDDTKKRTAKGNAICRTGVALGVITQDDWDTARKEGKGIDVPLDEGEGEECIIEVKLTPKKDKQSGRETGEFWANVTKSWRVDDPNVKDVPRGSTEEMETAGASDGSGFGDDW